MFKKILFIIIAIWGWRLRPVYSDSVDVAVAVFQCSNTKLLWIKKTQHAWEIALKKGNIVECVHDEVKCNQQKNYKFCRVMDLRGGRNNGRAP